MREIYLQQGVFQLITPLIRLLLVGDHWRDIQYVRLHAGLTRHQRSNYNSTTDLQRNRASVQAIEAGKERFARIRARLNALVDVLVGAEAPLRDRVRATTAVLRGSDLHVFLQEVDDRDKLGHRPRDGHRPDQLEGLT